MRALTTAMNHVFPVTTNLLGRGIFFSSHTLRPVCTSIAAIGLRCTTPYSTCSPTRAPPITLQLLPRGRWVYGNMQKLSLGTRWKSSVQGASRKATKAAKTDPRTPKSNTNQPPSSTDSTSAPPSQVHLSSTQVVEILGPGLTFEEGMQVLQELQTRRVTGSLADLGISFPDDPKITPEHAERGLIWLRDNYPVDEEAAAAEWAEEEIERLEGAYLKRAEELHLYKKTPEEEIEEEHLEEDTKAEEGQAVEVQQERKSEEKVTQIQQHGSRGLYGQSVLEQHRAEVEAAEKAAEKAKEEALAAEGKERQPEPYKGHDLIVAKKVELGTCTPFPKPIQLTPLSINKIS